MTDWRSLCKELFDLLDAVNLALDEPDRAYALIDGRFAIYERHGLKVEMQGETSGATH